MITATYFAALKNNQFYLSSVSPNDIFGNTINDEKIKNCTPVFNYANFFGTGIDLYDNNIVFGDENDYYGYLTDGTEIILDLYYDNTVADLKNGITVVFDKPNSCFAVEVWEADMNSDGIFQRKNLIGFSYDETGLPLTTHIPLSGFSEETTSLIILLAPPFFNTSYISLKGIVLGKILELNDFFSFNSIAELRPIGEDLPLNEINSTVLLTKEFVDEENQSIKYFDTGLMEDGVLVSVESADVDKYDFKSRNIINLVNENEELYNSFSREDITDWNSQSITAKDALDQAAYGTGIKLSYPEWFSTYKLSPYLPPCSGRKVLQQIAWATCCGIDTSYKNAVTFIPFYAPDINSRPDIVINNSDGRTLKSSVKKGEKYSTIIWEYTEYVKKEQIEKIGEIETKYIGYNGDFGSYGGYLTCSEPFAIDYFGNGDFRYSYCADICSPFSQYVLFDYEFTVSGYGYKYTPNKKKEIISTGIKNGKTLTISNQTVFPYDRSNKIAQLQKWYSMNNTLSATVVDNGDIRLGKTIMIQLANKTFFTGIITKVERSNISDYHTVTLEAHEWHY